MCHVHHFLVCVQLHWASIGLKDSVTCGCAVDRLIRNCKSYEAIN